MTTSVRETLSRPPITVTEFELARLTQLAEAALRRAPEIAEELLYEMERATVVDTDVLPSGVVGINSLITYRTDINEVRRVKLVMPLDADIVNNRVSILTPIGVALIGLSEGQTMDWKSRDGKTHHLTVLRVESSAPPPGASEDGDPRSATA